MRCALAVLTALLLLGLATSAASARSDYRWPRSEEKAFMASCTRTGAPAVRCGCALRWLENRYSFARITYLYKHRPQLLGRAMQRAVLACVR